MRKCSGGDLREAYLVSRGKRKKKFATPPKCTYAYARLSSVSETRFKLEIILFTEKLVAYHTSIRLSHLPLLPSPIADLIFIFLNKRGGREHENTRIHTHETERK